MLSSLSITSLASCVKNPKRFIGVHFFNPAPVMPLVEIIPGIQTEENSLTLSKQLIASWKKEIVVAKDTPGFIVNRIARPYYGEAIRIYEENLASKEYIDQTMKKLGGFKMGPFELMDFIGHDVNYAVTESVWTAFYFEPKYKPSLSQKRLVEAAYLGRKSGRGFYNYEDVSHESKDIELDLEKSTMIFERIICMLIHEAADALYLEIASKEDIETAMCKGVNYPKGLLHWADEIGIEKCVSIGRLVAIVFNPNPDNLPQINHIGKYPDGREGLKTDNRSISLKWITCKDNIHHSWKNELAKGLKGESHGSAKLTEQQVLNIRSSNLKNIRLAEIYRVSTASISLIKNRKVWKHI